MFSLYCFCLCNRFCMNYIILFFCKKKIHCITKLHQCIREYDAMKNYLLSIVVISGK